MDNMDAAEGGHGMERDVPRDNVDSTTDAMGTPRVLQ